MSEYDYAKEKFFQAVSMLVGADTIDKRLTYAADYLLRLQDKQLPESMRDEFKVLRDALTTTPLSTATGYQPRHISEDDTRKLAEKILSMYTELMGGL
jgi:hypothetical protein